MLRHNLALAGGPVVGASRNFKATQNAGTPNTKVDISADAV